MASSTGGVQTVERAIDLLEIMTDLGGDATLSELSERSGLPLPTIHRLLRTLVQRGYARQLPSRRYALGPGVLRLADAAGRQFGAAARPQLEHVAATLGETANLALLDHEMAVYVAQASSTHSMRMFTEVGRRVHLHCTGVGKMLLAGLDEDQVREIARRTGLPPATERSIAGPDELVAELARIRARGYAVDDGEQEIGVRCFAVAVPGAPVATALSVSGPAARVTPEFADEAVPVLREAAERVGARLADR
ncbi:IclR family transcriptional regulator [Myceligenerans indicum]|uniref:IclR family transcriptional regulator n=1 Tax=Myceligenerans indicum TaxID=2593663 RepID=A0ABS1LHM1_9MICO|nr:IclR family transcriptional regulator [Myceligenerans indicum]MBL0885318.1 IclR family transcriptional regulator [Myceligenerans indicum]